MNPYYIAYQADLRCDPNYSFEIGDVDSDGRLEFGCLNLDGNRLRFVRLDASVVFDCRLRSNGNWGTPLPSLFDINGDGADEVVVPDSSFNQIRRGYELLNEFAHEFYLADIEGDDADEIAFCTLDHINAGYGDREWNTGELVIMDHDGSTILSRGVDDYCRETHFDDLAVAGFRGEGKVDLLTEKGQLLDPHSGDVIWNVADSFDHGQWVAHAPAPGGGRTVFISEQTCSPTSHSCFATRRFVLRGFFLDAQVEGYWYNGEVRSRVADVDGDGVPEIVLPQQNGLVSIIKKRVGR